jgi:hypothetical protein
MIGDVDAALSRMLGEETYPGETIQVDLDPPTKDWAARRSGPVLNLFLNDVREDTRRRKANYQEVTNDKGVVISRRPSERTFMFTYALSAWTSRPADDHHLLGAAMVSLLQHEHIPQEYTSGALAVITNRFRPAILNVGGVMFSERLATELWSAVGGEYRPILAITVSVEIPTGLAVAAGPEQTSPPVFNFENTRTGTTSSVQGPSPTAPRDEQGNPIRERRREDLDRSTSPAQTKKK